MQQAPEHLAETGGGGALTLRAGGAPSLRAGDAHNLRAGGAHSLRAGGSHHPTVRCGRVHSLSTLSHAEPS